MRPQLEILEERLVRSITPHGGPVLQGAVENVLYLQGSGPDMGPFLQSLPAVYNGVLAAYGGAAIAGHGRDAVAASPGAYISDYQPGGISPLQQLLLDQIHAGRLPAPDGRQVYNILLPPGTAVTSPQDQYSTAFRGYHDYFIDPQTGAVVVYTVNLAQSSVAGLELVLSHEDAESASDPQLTGYSDSWTGYEIGDFYAGDTFAAGGHVYQILAQPNLAPAEPGANLWSVLLYGQVGAEEAARETLQALWQWELTTLGQLEAVWAAWLAQLGPLGHTAQGAPGGTPWPAV